MESVPDAFDVERNGSGFLFDVTENVVVVLGLDSWGEGYLDRHLGVRPDDPRHG